MRKREPWYDTLRLIACFVVYASHFIAIYREPLFVSFNRLPAAIVLYGVTGRGAVGLFGAITGYFAYRAGAEHPLRSVRRRYLYFLTCAVFVNVLTVVVQWRAVFSAVFTIPNILLHLGFQSLTLGSGFYGPFWCMPTFLLATLISLLNKKAGISYAVLFAEMIGFLLIGQVWMTVCLTGNLAAMMNDDENVARLFEKRFFRILLLLVLFIAIKQEETDLKALTVGFASAFLMVTVRYSPLLQKVLGARPLSSFGKNAMGIFLIHMEVLMVFSYLSPVKRMLETSLPVFWGSLFLCFALLIVLSYPVTALLKKAAELLDRLVCIPFSKKKRP